jgi:cobalamin biosynthesis protein CobD/CbiB
MADQSSDLAKALQDVTTRAQLIVREEIELAKLEVTTKATKLAKGAAVGAAAGVFVLGGLIYFLHFAAWGIADILGNDVWLGYLIVAVLLFLLAAIAGLLAYRFVKGGTPPTPQMAIEEAQRVRETISASRSDAGRTT